MTFQRSLSAPRHGLLFFLFLIVLLLAYGNSFHAAWQLDDKPNILKNHRIQIKDLSVGQLWQSMHARPVVGSLYRPVACLTLGVNWFFGGKNVFGYHVVNFLIHLGTCWLLFLTIIKLFATPQLKGRYSPGQISFMAVTGTLLWAINPIQTQAVTYIVQRMASLAALFSLLAIYCYLKARTSAKGKGGQSLLMMSAAVSYLFGLLSKENVALLPLVIPVLEFLFFRSENNTTNFKKIFIGLVLTACLGMIAGLALRPEAIDFVTKYYVNRPFTLAERFLTEQRILLLYLSQLFFPAPGRLSVEHDIILSTSLFSPWTTAAAFGINLLLISFALKINRRQPLLALAILFFYINHVVESTVVPLELIFEHRNYLPSIFLFLPVAQLLNSILSKIKDHKAAVTAVFVAVAMLLMAEGSATYARNRAWKTERSLWLDALKKAPNSSRPLATLAIKLAWGKNPTEAKYRKALQLTERTLSMRMSRKRLDAAQLGNMASIHNKLGEYEQAVRYYKKALSIAPKDASIRYNFTKTLIMSGDFKQARLEIESILNRGFVHADYYNILGFVDLWQGQPARALPSLQKALKLVPGRPAILLALGNCMSELGYYERAQWFLNLARKYGGEDVIVLLNLMQNALRRDDTRLAKKIWYRLLERYSLPSIFARLQPVSKRYQTVPLDAELLRPFMVRNIKLLPEFANVANKQKSIYQANSVRAGNG